MMIMMMILALSLASSCIEPTGACSRSRGSEREEKIYLCAENLPVVVNFSGFEQANKETK